MLSSTSAHARTHSKMLVRILAILIDLFLFYSFDVFQRFSIVCIFRYKHLMSVVFLGMMMRWLNSRSPTNKWENWMRIKILISVCLPKFDYKCQALQLFIIGKLFPPSFLVLWHFSPCLEHRKYYVNSWVLYFFRFFSHSYPLLWAISIQVTFSLFLIWIHQHNFERPRFFFSSKKFIEYEKRSIRFTCVYIVEIVERTKIT